MHAACQTITIFDSLRRRGLLTYNRPHTHLIFTTGLVLIFSVFVQIHLQEQRNVVNSEVDLGVWWAELDDNTDTPTLQESLAALSTAGNVLTWFAEQMPDIDVHRRFFEVLQRELEKIVNNHQVLERQLPVPVRSDSGMQRDTHNLMRLDETILPSTYHGAFPQTTLKLGTQRSPQMPTGS